MKNTCSILNYRCLKFLTLDSNSIGGDMVVKIIRATAIQKILEELRCSNQVDTKHFESVETIKHEKGINVYIILISNSYYSNYSLIVNILEVELKTILHKHY